MEIKKDYFNRFTQRRKAKQRGNEFMFGFFICMMALIITVYILSHAV